MTATFGRSAMVCGGCGTTVPDSEPYPFRCPHAGDGGDHVLRRVLDLSTVAFPSGSGDANPFVRYRELLHAYHVASAAGMDDAEFVALVHELDAAVASVDGRGFAETPFARARTLEVAVGSPGSLYVKDETGNVAGSHKARHLFGLLLYLEVVDRTGSGDGRARPLAIASCGNAALAAAVVAAAGGRLLRVFVPVDAEAPVVERLRALGASVQVCPRVEGTPGDPSYLRLQQAIASGALPFTCQGNENGLAVEGGMTLGYEIVSALLDRGAALDHAVVQVGGGALASAVWQAFTDAVALHAIPRPPRFHTVQTESAWPLARAYRRVAELLPEGGDVAARMDVLRRAAARRDDFMWPWETVPRSVAHGILDDETYDWMTVVEGMLETGGRALVVGEAELLDANRTAVGTTGIDVDETGSAGLAGLLRLQADGAVASGESCAVLFTGVRRR